MANLSRGLSFGTNEEVTADKLHALVDSGSVSGIVDADIDDSAQIVDTKLAQITTASKVSGAAITLISSLPAGAGVIPAVNLTSVAQKGANSDITSITGLTTPLDVNDVSGILGTWTTQQNDVGAGGVANYTKALVYLAATDGLVIIQATDNGSSHDLIILTDASNPPTTARATFNLSCKKRTLLEIYNDGNGIYHYVVTDRSIIWQPQ
jgi:hypothetical protein